MTQSALGSSTRHGANEVNVCPVKPHLQLLRASWSSDSRDACARQQLD